MSVHGKIKWTCKCRDCDFTFTGELSDMNEKVEEHLTSGDGGYSHELEITQTLIYYWEW